MEVFIIERQKGAIKQEKKKKLETIIDLKVQEIIHWRNERYADARIIYQNQLAANGIHEWLTQPTGHRDDEEILGWLRSKVQRNQYASAYLFDDGGTLRLTAGTAAEKLGAHVRADINEALKQRKIVFGDFEKDAEDISSHLDVFVPLILIHGSDTVSVAAVLLQIDPQEFFFPLLNSIPFPSKTSEALLVRQEGDSIVYVNGTKDNRHPPFSLRFPISQNQLVTAMSLHGEEGVVEGIDYSGIPVLAAVRKVPDSPWNLAVKVNVDEVYAPIRDRESTIEMVAGLLIIASGAFIGMLWRHERSVY